MIIIVMFTKLKIYFLISKNQRQEIVLWRKSPGNFRIAGACLYQVSR